VGREKSSREKTYAEQLKTLGIYDPAFEPEIKQLAQLERELTRAKKAWSNTVPKDKAPSFEDPHYEIIRRLRNEILQHRETLGLTPKSYQRLRGRAAAGDPAEASSGNRALSAILSSLEADSAD
jgi:hypothetical protein